MSMQIGVSNDIKKRILAHWNSKKDFDRLMFGKMKILYYQLIHLVY